MLSSGVLCVDAPVNRNTNAPSHSVTRQHVSLRTVDFGGQREYLYTHRLFCISRAVYALCVSVDEWFDKPATDVVHVLRDYMSMVQMRAPKAPVALVFTKADRVLIPSTSGVPDSIATWGNQAARALLAEFPQLGIGNHGEPDALVVSAKDGWDACQEHLLQRLAHLALASPGAGDVLPHSYGTVRDALSAAGMAWKQAPGDTTPADSGGAEECKGVEGAACEPANSTAAPPHASLAMRWGTRVPVVTVAAVRNLAIHHCGLSRDAGIHELLQLLHSMGTIVYGGALSDSYGNHRNPTDLSQLVVLDAQWLADMLSRIVTQYARRFDDSGRLRRGRVSLRDVASAFHGYPDDLRASFMEVVFALEIAFPGMNNDGSAAEHFIVPALLPLAVSGAEEGIAKRAIAGVRDETRVSVSVWSNGASVWKCLLSVCLSPVLHFRFTSGCNGKAQTGTIFPLACPLPSSCNCSCALPPPRSYCSCHALVVCLQQGASLTRVVWWRWQWNTRTCLCVHVCGAEKATFG